MAQAAANGVTLEFDTFGDTSNPAMLMIMGLGVQMIVWDDRACKELADSGYFVIRFDNRDCGLSTKFDSFGIPDILAGLVGDDSTAGYSLIDMARDAVGLLDFLNIKAAHVVGISMGGMIAQQAVIDYPDRFLSLCSIMSSTGSREVGQPSPEAIGALLQPMAQDRETSIARSIAAARVIGSPAYFNEKKALEIIERSYDRGHYPDGVARQLMAILVSPDRTEALRKVSIPTLVIHGLSDKLVDPSGGYATANAIPNSRLLTFEGLGHDLPDQLWPEFLDAIVANAKRAE